MRRVSGARPTVQAVGGSVEFILTLDREACAFRQILAQQPVGVFAVPHCQGLCGSQKYAFMPVAAVSS